MLSPCDLPTSWTVHGHPSPQAPYSTVWYVNEMLDVLDGCKLVCQQRPNGEFHTASCSSFGAAHVHRGRVLSHQISSLTSFWARPKMEDVGLFFESVNPPVGASRFRRGCLRPRGMSGCTHP